MTQLIQEVKRFQQLAGIITESQLSEISEPEKKIVDAILDEGINEGKFDPKEILAKLIAVAKKGLLTATIISTVLASCNFSSSTEDTIQRRLDQYKTIDSMELQQKEKDQNFKKEIDSLTQHLNTIAPSTTPTPQQESIEQAVNEALKKFRQC
jgi:hypothetical protein